MKIGLLGSCVTINFFSSKKEREATFFNLTKSVFFSFKQDKDLLRICFCFFLKSKIIMKSILKFPNTGPKEGQISKDELTELLVLPCLGNETCTKLIKISA